MGGAVAIFIAVQIQHYLSLLRFSYFIIPYDAQASISFSALINLRSGHKNC